ncbi:EAL domain-containing protein [Neptunicella marina]|uniref:EAL domain-containing protein n=1 Tax=Neptunicella marina TaxID=2125989 RepID=A0A8J6IR98_9ALTE|nr:EAL domain-containing protein [Neptunicella marina]MBC3764447.1 EAL domain-containing protein [Neptunicella marina]
MFRCQGWNTLFAALLMLFCSLSFANPISTKYRFSTLTASHGLPSVEVLGIYQQKSGYIWIATDSGISRYDGKHFKTLSYTHGSSKGLTNNFVTSMVEDSQGNLWVTTEDGLNKIQLNGHIKHFLHSEDPDSIPTNWLLNALVVRPDKIWIGSGNGLIDFNPVTEQFTSMPVDDKFNMSMVMSLAQQNDNTLWVGTSEGLGYLSEDNGKVQPFFSGDEQLDKLLSRPVYKLLIHQNTLWVATEGAGLFAIDLNNHKVTHYSTDTSSPLILAENKISSLVVDRYQRLWLGYFNKGISVIDLNKNSIMHLQHDAYSDASIPGNQVNHLAVDSSDLVWVSTHNGVAFYSPVKEGTTLYYKTLNNKGLVSNNVWGSEVSNGNIWVATDMSLERIDPSQQTVTHIIDYKNDSDTQQIWNVSVHRGKQDSIWVAQNDGISQINPSTGEIVQTYSLKNEPIQDGEVYDIVQDGDYLWLANRYTGLSQYSLIEKRVVKRFLYQDNDPYVMAGNFPYQLVQAKNGDLLIAASNGMYRVDPIREKIFHVHLGDNGSQTIRVNSITEDDTGAVWIATQGMGLVKVTFDAKTHEPNEPSYITLADPEIDTRIKNVYYTQHNQLWFTTVNQVGSIDTQNHKLTVYSNIINMPNWQFLEASISAMGQALYIGSNKGLLKIDTTRDYNEFFDAPVVITDIEVSNKILTSQVINQGERIDFESDQNALRFSFAALDYTAPTKNRYRYKLNGYDDNWQDIGNRTEVYFTNLPPGNYDFQLQGTNSNGDWSVSSVEFAFKINNPWWLYVFYLLILITTISIGWIIFVRQLRIKELNQLANYDQLTGLANRRLFNHYLTSMVDDPNKKPFVLLYLDLDHFKQVNDLWGHNAGDELLLMAAERLNENKGSEDKLARLGGDEFALIINGDVNNQQVKAKISRISTKLSSGYHINKRWVKGSASIGITAFPRDGLDSITLLKNADTAMYEAKKGGRNRFHVYNPELSQRVTSRINMEARLRHALNHGLLDLYFQPKVQCNGRGVCGFEALLRWNDAENGWISPAEFIPLAEESDLILKLGEWVTINACQKAAEWYHRGLLKNSSVAINVSAPQLFRSDMFKLLRTQLDKYDIPGNCIELEITETSLLEHVKQARQILTELKTLGISISLDDFGTGFSSLNYLTTLPIDVLKVDKSFIDTILTDNKTAVMLKNIFNLARELNMKVVAEGVESADQFQELLVFNCDLVQGFLFSPAVNAHRAEQMLLGHDDQLRLQIRQVMQIS